MSTNTNVTTIPGLFQFPPSLESEIAARPRRHDSDSEMHLQSQQEGVPEYYRPMGAFVARRSSTSMITSSSAAAGAGTSSRGQGFSLAVRHPSLTASGLRSNAIARPANPPPARDGATPLGQRGAYPLISHLPSHHSPYPQPPHPFLPTYHPHPTNLHGQAQSLSPAPPPPPPPSSAPPFASAPRMLAPPHGAHPHAPHTFAYAPADGDGDMDINMRAAPHEERYPSGHFAYPSASPPHLLATHTEEDVNVVKQEDLAQDEPMMWSHNPFYPHTSGVQPSYSEQLVDEPTDEPMYGIDVKPEPYHDYTHAAGVDGNVIDESWNNVLTYAEEPLPPSSAPLCIDTSAAVSQDYSALPFGPGIDMFSDRTLDVQSPEMHQFYQQYQQHPPSPGPSLHTIPPPPSSQTRSYTLEGAITPISPNAPAHVSFASASASSSASAHTANRRESANQPLPTSSSYSHTNRALSPPPMGSLQPPSPHKQSPRSNPRLHSYPQQVALEPSTAPASHAADRHTPSGTTVTTTSTYSTATSANTTPPTEFSATISSSPHHPSIPTSAPVPTPAPASTQAQTRTQVVPGQKRPRGRPRKNPPGAAARVSSPPPAVDYPFPHFPDSHSASVPASTDSRPGNASGRGCSDPRSAGGKGMADREVLEEAEILPPMSHPLPTLTVGTAGSTGPLPSSSPSASSHTQVHPHTSPGTSSGSGSSKGHGNVPPGLTAGQGIFKLNVPNDVEPEGADGAGATGTGSSASRSGAGGKGVEGEKKKPIMACLFCRERKIACGPPPPGAPRRCNQCTRRDLVCEYPKESRRGQHKRGARAARVEALASGAAAAASASSSTSTASSSLNSEGSNASGKAKANDKSNGLTVNPGAVPFPSPSVVSPPPPPSPLTPLSSPPASGSSASSAATERPSRSEKICIERAGRSGSSGEGKGQRSSKAGKERSQSRAPAREAWGDSPLAAARRVLQQQQKKRAVTGAAAAMAGAMAYLGAGGSGSGGGGEDEMSGVEMGMVMAMGAAGVVPGSSELSYALAGAGAGAMGAPQMSGMGR